MKDDGQGAAGAAKGSGLTDRQAIRSAMLHAIEDRLSYLEAIKGCDMVKDETRINALIAHWRKLLRQRYGDDRLPLDIMLEGTVAVPVKIRSTDP